MLKKIFVKKIRLGLILTSLSLFCVQTQAAIIASFDSGVNVNVSSTYSENVFKTGLFDSDLFLEGYASGDASGSDDSAAVVLDSNGVASVRAAADGTVSGIESLAVGIWSTDGYFYFENNTGSDVTIDVTFDISWFARIFTSSFNEEAVAYASIYIENWDEDIIFYQTIDVDSLFDGPGAFDFSDYSSLDLSVTLADVEFEQYFMAVDSGGFAVNVPEPSGLLLAGLVLMIAVRKRKRSAWKSK